MSRANEENNEFDDIFTKADDSDGNDDFFSSLNDSQNDDAAFDMFAAASTDAESVSESVSIETVPDGLFGDGDGESNPFGEFPAPNTEIAAEEALPTENKKGKKGKKAKTPKAAKGAKAPKTKKSKEAKSDARYGSAKPFYALAFLFLLGVIGANVYAFMSAGANSAMFLACFDALAAVLIATPLMLVRQLRTRAVGLFDVFLALVAAFLTIAAMATLAQQAQNYGASSKVASTVAAASFDLRA